MDLYRRLKGAIAKRMYRFLDKRFHFGGELKFDLRAFACDHLGLSRCYDNGELKRRLAPAIRELEQVGFLEVALTGDRYKRICRGKWNVHFVQAGGIHRRERHETQQVRPPARPGGKRRPAIPTPAAAQEPAEEKAVAAYLASLSADGLREVEREALANADAEMKQALARCERSGTRRAANAYRRLVLHRHVLQVLKGGKTQ